MDFSDDGTWVLLAPSYRSVLDDFENRLPPESKTWLDPDMRFGDQQPSVVGCWVTGSLQYTQ
jgi:hypothetical protein